MARIAEVHIFDFDATLFKSPQKPSDYSGPWWSQEFSLGPPCMEPDAPYWISSAVSAAKRSISRSDVYAAVCTGRKEHLRPIVQGLLDRKGLNFAKLFLSPGGATATYKENVFKGLSRKFPGATFHIWEDRHDHLAGFVRLLQGLGHEAIGHPVPEQYSQAQCSGAELEAMISRTARIAGRYLRRKASSDPMGTLQEVSQHMQAVDTWAKELDLHVKTMLALIAAGESRRLGRTSAIQVGSVSWDGRRISATVKGTTSDYQTHITIQPKRGHRCTCPDWQKNGKRVGPCKHVLRLGQVWLEESVTPALNGLDSRLEDILSRSSL
jgi:hypothetical protein